MATAQMSCDREIGRSELEVLFRRIDAPTSEASAALFDLNPIIPGMGKPGAAKPDQAPTG